MEEKIAITENLLKNIFNSESSKLVGKVMRRWETLTNENDRKSDVKDLIYEGLRDIRDLIIACSKVNEPINLKIENKKSEGKNGTN